MRLKEIHKELRDTAIRRCLFAFIESYKILVDNSTRIGYTVYLLKVQHLKRGQKCEGKI